MRDVRGALRLQQLRPWCAACERRVERLELIREELRSREILRAYCHGDHEDTVLDDEMMLLLGVHGPYTIEPGVAFRLRALDRRRDA